MCVHLSASGKQYFCSVVQSSQLLFSILIGNTIFSIAQKAQWVLGNTGLANMLVWLWENEHFGQPNT